MREAGDGSTGPSGYEAERPNPRLVVLCALFYVSLLVVCFFATDSPTAPEAADDVNSAGSYLEQALDASAVPVAASEITPKLIDEREGRHQRVESAVETWARVIERNERHFEACCMDAFAFHRQLVHAWLVADGEMLSAARRCMQSEPDGPEQCFDHARSENDDAWTTAERAIRDRPRMTPVKPSTSSTRLIANLVAIGLACGAVSVGLSRFVARAWPRVRSGGSHSSRGRRMLVTLAAAIAPCLIAVGVLLWMRALRVAGLPTWAIVVWGVATVLAGYLWHMRLSTRHGRPTRALASG